MKIKSSIWFENEGKAFFGKGRIELLEQIEKTGSISKAAKAMKMSYKAAWDAVNEMNSLSSEPIVERETGGKGGGGTRLTEKGKEYIRIFKEIDSLQQKVLGLLGEKAKGYETLCAFSSRLTLQTSARNQYLGEVVSIETTKVGADILLKIGQDHTIKASITRKSAKKLGVKPGMELFALIKSSWVTLSKDGDGSGKMNALPGVVKEVERDSGRIEARVLLNSQNDIVAVMESEKFSKSGFNIGDEVYALFNPSDVILAR